MTPRIGTKCSKDGEIGRVYASLTPTTDKYQTFPSTRHQVRSHPSSAPSPSHIHPSLPPDSPPTLTPRNGLLDPARPSRQAVQPRHQNHPERSTCSCRKPRTRPRCDHTPATNSCSRRATPASCCTPASPRGRTRRRAARRRWLPAGVPESACRAPRQCDELFFCLGVWSVMSLFFPEAQKKNMGERPAHVEQDEFGSDKWARGGGEKGGGLYIPMWQCTSQLPMLSVLKAMMTKPPLGRRTTSRLGGLSTFFHGLMFVAFGGEDSCCKIAKSWPARRSGCVS